MSSHPQSVYGHQQHSIEPKRFNGFFSPSATSNNTNTAPSLINPDHFQFNSLFGSHPAQQQPQFNLSSSSSGLQFTDDELIESLIHRQPINNGNHLGEFPHSPQSSSLTQPISFDQITLLDHPAHRHSQPHSHSNPAHHHPIPITTRTAATSPDSDRRRSFSSSVPIEDQQLLLSPSSTNPARSPSTMSSVSRTTANHQRTFRASRSPNPKPLLNRHPQQAAYPFSPPTSITTTLVDEERSPAISTISVTESSTHHHLSSSQPIGSSFYRPLPSADDATGLPSPLDRMSDELSLSSSLPTRRTFSPHSIIDQQKLVLNEKRRKRRESHNAVERRRRDNINDRITELAGLLPTCLLDTVVTPNESGMMMVVNEEPSQADDSQGLNSASHTKPNKGMILAKSVDYIKHLKHLLELQSQRNTELEAELKRVRSGTEPHQEDPKQQGTEEKVRGGVTGEDEENVKGEEGPGPGGMNEDTSDQIHQWIKIHDQQNDPQNQNESQLEDENMMMTNGFGQDAVSYRPDHNMAHRHHLSSSSDPTNHHHAHNLSTSEPIKFHEDHYSSSLDHFASPFNHRLGSFENIYYHLQ
ncbi:uncharacterized protein PGTG_09722 [Puccinia graminis f. sp. tritici CRL 75-36-700-3]|uniref:BHLH domain-containing protein n=1 Tax=Puccinia graminis f. sp. tritici (strain CRL 75-36-700-3 / race SCCL) TaxID=418459 RepID=E3KI84_PUCGT|nr:uncharacterized protein PGTG_09722 [Puccinia graminis f. sp. tritici CRL 75-36-700-3]EFP84009.1 hypothetical protein PGTG_09722 [Puccinia graminis f. sp. tritici CRL 75-36-700-3]